MSFFEMGGYALYVWSAFGAAALILFFLLFVSLRGLRKAEKVHSGLEPLAAINQPDTKKPQTTTNNGVTK